MFLKTSQSLLFSYFLYLRFRKSENRQKTSKTLMISTILFSGRNNGKSNGKNDSLVFTND